MHLQECRARCRAGRRRLGRGVTETIGGSMTHREDDDHRFGVVNVQPEFASGGSGLDPVDRSGNEHA